MLTYPVFQVFNYESTCITVRVILVSCMVYNYTVEPLIKEPQNKGCNRNNLSIKDTS